MKLTSMVELDAWAMFLVQKRPVEGAIDREVNNKNANICSPIKLKLLD